MRHAEFLRHHQVSSFFVLAFVYFWTWEGVLYVVFPNGFPGGLTQAPLPVLLYALLGATASGVTGIILMRVLDGRRGLSELADRLKRWRVDVKWYAAAIFTTAIATTATLMVLAATVSQKFLPTFLAGQNIVTLLPVAAIIGLIAGFVEEFGWTGFALPRLLARFPAICASLILGIIWSAWHIFPYFWGTPTPYTSLDIASALFFIGALIPYRILIAWIYINSRGSLLLAIIMHACYDASLIVLVPYASLSQLQSVQFYAGLNGALWVAAVGVTAIFGKRLTLAVSLRKTKVPSPSLAPLYEARAIVVSNKDIQDSWTSIGCDKEKLLGLLDTYSNKAMAHASLSVAVIFGIFGLLSYVSFERPLLDPMVVFIVALYVIIYFALCILAGILTLNFTYYSRVSEKMN